MTLITTVVSHRTVEIQTDPLAPPLLVTRTALIAASRAVQSSEDGLAEVKGRFPRLGAGHAFLDESQISQLIGDLYISASPTADSGSVLATAYEGRWSISSYELEAASGFVTSANGATVSFANYATSAGDIGLTEVGEYLLQMVTGHLAGLVRIVNVLPASGPATIVLNTAFLPAPSAGDKFVLLRRGSGTLSVGGSAGTYQGALLNTQGNLIPAGTTMMTEAEATAAISAATNNIPATRLTGLSTQVALQASGNNAYEPLTDVFGVPLGRVLPN